MTTTAVSHQRPGIEFMGRRKFVVRVEWRPLLVDSTTDPYEHLSDSAIIPCVIRDRRRGDSLLSRRAVAV